MGNIISDLLSLKNKDEAKASINETSAKRKFGRNCAKAFADLDDSIDEQKGVIVDAALNIGSPSFRLDTIINAEQVIEDSQATQHKIKKLYKTFFNEELPDSEVRDFSTDSLLKELVSVKKKEDNKV